MPLYEYTCIACSRRFSWLVGVVADSRPPTCPRCGASSAEKRAVSRCACVRTDEQALDALGDLESATFGDQDDPKTMQRWAREMGALTGERNGLGEEFDEYIDDAAAAGPERLSSGDGDA